MSRKIGWLAFTAVLLVCAAASATYAQAKMGTPTHPALAAPTDSRIADEARIVGSSPPAARPADTVEMSVDVAAVPATRASFSLATMLTVADVAIPSRTIVSQGLPPAPLGPSPAAPVTKTNVQAPAVVQGPATAKPVTPLPATAPLPTSPSASPTGCVSISGGPCITQCADGTWSSSTGSGTCSSHGGEALGPSSVPAGGGGSSGGCGSRGGPGYRLPSGKCA